jgi:hypothetical protein
LIAGSQHKEEEAIMLRKFTGGATLLLGMAVLLTGFYAPAHSTIYFQ